MTLNPAITTRPFQYKHGDRPLDGFTIQRALGCGGFGEVYYAISDSGKDVALKVINVYAEVEKRGVRECLNLKNPHLVTIYDVKDDPTGRPWVIMEFIAGPSLQQLLDESPSGLGADKAKFFVREIGKGLTYIHENGTVHRDLKPSNIYYENDLVKIGDYGLAKAMSVTQFSGQTANIGTPTHMAPEVGEGNYGRSIDIYALGVVLYQMMTGRVPFVGQSFVEILMKHLNTQVDVSGIEEPFRSVIAKAMAKNPADRYQTAAEMVEALCGPQARAPSLSQYSPPPARSPVPRPPPARPAPIRQWRRWRRWAYAAAAGVALLGLFFILLGRHVAMTPRPTAVSLSTEGPAIPAAPMVPAPTPTPTFLPVALTFNTAEYQVMVARACTEAARTAINNVMAGTAAKLNANGDKFRFGQGVPPDLSQAMNWYRGAADMGDANAMFSVALMYENGMGVAKDLSMARAWYGKAAEAGNPQGRGWLDGHREQKP